MATPTFIAKMVTPETAEDVLFGLVVCSGKLAPFIADLIRKGDYATIASVWTRIDTNTDPNIDNAKSIATLRSTLSRQAKNILGHGLTYKNGEIVAATTRKRTETDVDSKLVQLAKVLDVKANDELKAKLVNLLQAAVDGLGESA